MLPLQAIPNLFRTNVQSIKGGHPTYLSRHEPTVLSFFKDAPCHHKLFERMDKKGREARCSCVIFTSSKDDSHPSSNCYHSNPWHVLSENIPGIDRMYSLGESFQMTLQVTAGPYSMDLMNERCVHFSEIRLPLPKK